MDVFAENILDHYRHPRNKKAVLKPTVTHEEANYACGDMLGMQLYIVDGMIKKVGWEGTGCAISQASMSLLSEKLTGMPVKEAALLQKKDILDLLHIPIGTRRMKCALLCLHTLKNALHIAEGKTVQSWLDTVEIDQGTD